MDCRDLILQRIPELVKTGSATHLLFVHLEGASKRKLKMLKRQIEENGKWPSDFDFSSLNDEELVKAFERISWYAYRSWA